MIIRRRVVVHGLVQGVFFRDSVRRRASSADLSGWVRNTAEGAVEGVEALVAFCREGPRGSRVDRVEVIDEPAEGIRGFSIR